MEDDRDGCGPQVRGAATQGEEEHQSRAKAKGKKIANAFGSSSGAGGSRLASDIGDRPTSPAVVTRSGTHAQLKGPINKPWSHGERWKANEFKCFKMDRFYRSPSVSKAAFDIDLGRSMSPLQPRIDIMLQGDAKVRLGKVWAKWFHANDEGNPIMEWLCSSGSYSSAPGIPMYVESGDSGSGNESDGDDAVGVDGSGATAAHGGVGARGSGSNGGAGAIGEPKLSPSKIN